MAFLDDLIAQLWMNFQASKDSVYSQLRNHFICGLHGWAAILNKFCFDNWLTSRKQTDQTVEFNLLTRIID